MKKRRKVIIGGDEYEVMEEGNCFIQTKRHRYSWREGELKSYGWEERPVTPYVDLESKSGRDIVKAHLVEAHKTYTGRDIVELYGPDYDSGRGHECWIRFAGVERAEKFPAPKVEDVSAIYAVRGEMVGNDDAGHQKDFGKLTVYGDFERVMFSKIPYDLRDAPNARSILRFLCGCAVGKSKAKSKADIRKRVDTVNSDWRPSQDFRNHLKSLFGCVGSHRGMYWIKD
jgi:hypothetical protein